MLGKFAIFTTLNENYAKHAIVSFESFRIHNPQLNSDFIIFANDLSEDTKSKIKANNIKHIQLDLSDVFKTEADWPYPSECFWLFKAPCILHELGYSHSMYVDADVQCISNMNLNWLEKLPLIAGANRGSTLKQFLIAIDNFSKISNIFDLDKKKTGSISINSGVLFFNNQAYSKSNFYEKTVEIFKKSKESGFPRKGDDSLLCLTMAVHSDLEYTVLPVSWNDYRFYTNPRSDHRKSMIIHNASQKPWNPIRKTYFRNPYVQAFVSQWRKIRKKMEDDGRL